MDRIEHLLVIAVEECAEVQKELCKALRFGLGDHNPSDPERTVVTVKIAREFADLIAVMEMLHAETEINLPGITGEMLDAKKQKVEEMLRYSAAKGTYTSPPPPHSGRSE